MNCDFCDNMMCNGECTGTLKDTIRILESALEDWKNGDVGWEETIAMLENWMKKYPVSVFPDDPPPGGGDSGPEFVRAIRKALKQLANRSKEK